MISFNDIYIIKNNTLTMISELSKSLSNYTTEYLKVVDNNPKSFEYERDLNLFFVTIVRKNLDSINAVIQLLALEAPEKVYFSMASILRGSLLDSLFITYLCEKVNSSIESEIVNTLKDEIRGIYSDQLDFFLRDLKVYFKERNEPTSFKNEVLNDINLYFSDFFKEKLTAENIDKKGLLKFNLKRHNAKYLMESSLLKYKSLAFKLFDGYVFFSKFEHLGLLSIKFHSRINTNQNKELKQLVTFIEAICRINALPVGFFKITEEAQKELICITETIIKEIQNYLNL